MEREEIAERRELHKEIEILRELSRAVEEFIFVCGRDKDGNLRTGLEGAFRAFEALKTQQALSQDAGEDGKCATVEGKK